MSEAKTEEPTPRQERRARERGRAWQSRDLTSGAVLVALGGALSLGAGTAREAWTAPFRRALGDVARGGPIAPGAALEESLASVVALGLPLLASLVIVGAIVSAAQLGGLVAPGAIAPDAARLDPSARSGAAGPRAASAALFGLARLALLLAVGAITLGQAMPGIATLSRQAPEAAFAAGWTVASALALRAGVGLLFFGVLDAIVERVLFRMSLRMTKREKERDQRDAEGDAHVRRERDRIRDAAHREGDLDAAREAVLVVTGGDDLAIALSYDAEDPEAVPRVAAIGRAASAAELVRTAREAGVRAVEDLALAEQLAIVDAGASIPDALFEPVARAMSGAS